MCSILPPSISPGSAADERKRKRLQCNRESARRSRIKKQQKVDGLTEEVQRLRDEINLLRAQAVEEQRLRRDEINLLRAQAVEEQRLRDEMINLLRDENRKLREVIDGASQPCLDLVSENNLLSAPADELADRLSSHKSMLGIPSSEVSGLAFDISADTLLDLWELTASSDMFHY